MADYYNIPFSFKKLVSKERLERVDLKQSIENHIKGMLMTGYHSYRFDPDYGCKMKDYDFELITSVHAWRHGVERNLQDSISKHETRVKNVRVKVKMEDVAYNNNSEKAKVSLRKKLNIDISATIKSTNTQYQFPVITIFISPLSYN